MGTLWSGLASQIHVKQRICHRQQSPLYQAFAHIVVKAG
jgi:hypothetical protein